MKPIKHILFLPAWYPHKFDNMWGLFVRKHAEAISLHHHISILYLHAVENQSQIEEWKEVKEDHIYTLYIYYSKPKYKIWYIIRWLRLYFKGIRHIRKQKKPDIIHVHILSRMGLVAYLNYLIYKTPYIITEHWSRYLPNVNTYKGWFRKSLTEIVVKNAKAVLPVTANLKKAMISQGLLNNNYQIIPNVVDDMFFSSIPHQSGSVKRIIHVSTFEDRSKNISGIIDAIQQLKLKRNDFNLILIGDGQDFEKMKQKSKDLQLEGHIIFTGLLNTAELVNEYEQASFMIINSRYENMPVVINEAFACGLPVLSTNVGGISEHLNIDRGILIEPEQPNKLVEQINWMLDHYKDFDSSEIRKYASNHFSMKAVAQELNNIYQSIG